MFVMRPDVRRSPKARWYRLIGRNTGLAPMSFPLFTTRDVRRVMPRPHEWLARARSAGAIVTVGQGLHVVVPEGVPDGWMPEPVETALLVGSLRFGRVLPYVSGISAAALHGVCLPPRGEVHITVPRQARARPLPTLGTTVRFHQRLEHHVGGLPFLGVAMPRDVEGPVLDTAPGELCDLRLTSRSQTALDVMHSPARMGVPGDPREVAIALIRDLPTRDVVTTATRQRRNKAYERMYRLRA